MLLAEINRAAPRRVTVCQIHFCPSTSQETIPWNNIAGIRVEHSGGGGEGQREIVADISCPQEHKYDERATVSTPNTY